MIKKIISALVVFSLVLPTAYSWAQVEGKDTNLQMSVKKITKSAPGLNPDALSYAIKGYTWAAKNQQVSKPGILTLIDFSQPSNKKRLWVVDLNKGKVLFNTYTTQGKASGTVYAKSFSNHFNTKKSSIGVFKAANSYYGKHGFSLRIKGLEKGINDNAYSRAIVIHPAYYASEKFVKDHNRAGRSWGCFALDPSISKSLINTIKDGSIIFAYAAQSKQDKNLVSV